jgi:hypothetical protein
MCCVDKMQLINVNECDKQRNLCASQGYAYV